MFFDQLPTLVANEHN